MDLQSTLVLLGMFREKYLQPPKAKSIERENNFISSALGPDKHSVPSLGAERRSLLSIGREEKGQGHGHPSIHPSKQMTIQAETHPRPPALTLKGGGHSLLAFIGRHSPAQLPQLSHSKALQGKLCSQRGIASQHRKEA